MKLKPVVVGLLSLAALAGCVKPALAFFWKHKQSKCSTYICIRPYNAFSPVCFGSLNCDGCCPMPVCAPMAPPPRLYMPPVLGPYADCCAPGFSFYPPANGYQGMPSPGGNHFMPPPPTPLPNGAFNGQMPNVSFNHGYPANGFANVSYYPPPHGQHMPGAPNGHQYTPPPPNYGHNHQGYNGMPQLNSYNGQNPYMPQLTPIMPPSTYPVGLWAGHYPPGNHLFWPSIPYRYGPNAYHSPW